MYLVKMVEVEEANSHVVPAHVVHAAVSLRISTPKTKKHPQQQARAGGEGKKKSRGGAETSRRDQNLRRLAVGVRSWRRSSHHRGTKGPGGGLCCIVHADGVTKKSLYDTGLPAPRRHNNKHTFDALLLRFGYLLWPTLLLYSRASACRCTTAPPLSTKV